MRLFVLVRKNDIKDIFKLSGVFIGGIIGAGFASGREISDFFLVYGDKWILGLFICGIIFSMCLFGTINILNRNKGISDYKGFMEYIMGKRLGGIMEKVSGIFLCVLFFAMISASGSAGEEAFGINFNLGVIVMLFLCLFIFIKGEEGIIKLNAFLAPILVIGCIFLGINSLYNEKVQTFNIIGRSWFFSSILYASYNIITIIPVIVPLKNLAGTFKKAFLSGIISGMGIFIIGFCVALSMWLSGEGYSGNIPMLSVISKYDIYIVWIYKIVLLAAIFTTASANGYGAIKWIEKRVNINKAKLYGIIMVLGGLFSKISFSEFVGVLYPFFGYVGIYEIAVIIFFIFMKRNINCKQR